MFRCLVKWLRGGGLCLQQQSYWFLRIAKTRRWQPDDETGKFPTAEEALQDLKLRPEERGLSLYRLHREDEADELACIYSLTLRDNPGHFEYVLFPDGVLSKDDRIVHVPVEEHLRFLSERHYEIPALAEEQLLRLAERILNSTNKQVGRVRQKQLVDFAIQHGFLEREEFHNRIGKKWRELILKKKKI